MARGAARRSGHPVTVADLINRVGAAPTGRASLRSHSSDDAALPVGSNVEDNRSGAGSAEPTSRQGAKHRREPDIEAPVKTSWYGHTAVKAIGVLLLFGLIGSILYGTQRGLGSAPQGATNQTVPSTESNSLVMPLPTSSATNTVVPPSTPSPDTTKRHTSSDKSSAQSRKSLLRPQPPSYDWQNNPIASAIRSHMQGFPFTH